MPLLTLFRAWLAAQVLLLGDAEYAAREAAEARLGNVVCVLFLPATHADPEIGHRLDRLHRRHGKWFRSAFLERAVCRGDFGLWLDRYFCPGRNAAIGDEEAWEDLRQDLRRVQQLDDRWRLPRDDWVEIPYVPDWYDFKDFLDYHRNVVPPPREK